MISLFLSIVSQKRVGAKLQTLSTRLNSKANSGHTQGGSAYGQGLFQHGCAHSSMRRDTVVDRFSYTQHGLEIFCKLLHSHVVIIIVIAVMDLNLIFISVGDKQWYRTSKMACQAKY
jgi:hypothetical protein